MSTYTNIRTRVKENVSVGIKDRATDQQVRFMNEQNEFHGTFRGSFIDAGLVLSSATVQDSIISGGVAAGVTFMPDVKISAGGSEVWLSALKDVVDGLETGSAIVDPVQFRQALGRADDALSAGMGMKYEQLLSGVLALRDALKSFKFAEKPDDPEPGPEPPRPAFVGVYRTGYEMNPLWAGRCVEDGLVTIIGENLGAREPDDYTVTVSDGGYSVTRIDAEPDGDWIRCRVSYLNGDLSAGNRFRLGLGFVCDELADLGGAYVDVVSGE